MCFPLPFPIFQLCFECDLFCAEDIVRVGSACIASFHTVTALPRNGQRLHWSFTRRVWRRLRIWNGACPYDFILYHNLINFGVMEGLPGWIAQIENTWEAMAVFREHMRLHPAEYEEDSDSETLSWGQ